MNNDFLVLLAAGAIVLTSLTSAAGCARRYADIPSPTPAPIIETMEVTPAEEDAQAAQLASPYAPAFARNPVMDFTGDYHNGKSTLLVEASGEEKAMLTVVLSGDSKSQTVFTANTKFDEDTNSIVYTNGTKKIVKFDKDGNVVSEKKVYTNSTGRFVFGSQKALWTDSNEQVSNLIFDFDAPVNV